MCVSQMSKKLHRMSDISYLSLYQVGMLSHQTLTIFNLWYALVLHKQIVFKTKPKRMFWKLSAAEVNLFSTRLLTCLQWYNILHIWQLIKDKTTNIFHFKWYKLDHTEKDTGGCFNLTEKVLQLHICIIHPWVSFWTMINSCIYSVLKTEWTSLIPHIAGYGVRD